MRYLLTLGFSAAVISFLHLDQHQLCGVNILSGKPETVCEAPLQAFSEQAERVSAPVRNAEERLDPCFLSSS